MSVKSLGKLGLLVLGGFVALSGLFPARLSAQMLYLQAGTTTTITNDQATCEHEVANLGDPPTGGPAPTEAESGCSGGQLTMDLVSGNPENPFNNSTINLTAYSQLIVQFQVDTQPNAPDVSVLPVQISVPVTWEGTLFNSNVIPITGPLAPAAAYSDVNGELFLAVGQLGNPRYVGTTLASNNFMGSYHGGILGCLTVPKTKVQAAVMAAKCAVDINRKEQGNGTVYLSGMIQTGQIYDLVLQLEGDIYTLGNYFEVAGIYFQDNRFGQDPFGLSWAGPMKITIGTDYQNRIGDFQNQIDELRSQLDLLEHQFDTHTHVYMTGKGVGQNNTQVNTGPPKF
jgi:hypothetical protein